MHLRFACAYFFACWRLETLEIAVAAEAANSRASVADARWARASAFACDLVFPLTSS